jgi:hypothetical protein
LTQDPLTGNRYALASGNPIGYAETDGHWISEDGGGGAASIPNPRTGKRQTWGSAAAATAGSPAQAAYRSHIEDVVRPGGLDPGQDRYSCDTDPLMAQSRCAYYRTLAGIYPGNDWGLIGTVTNWWFDPLNKCIDNPNGVDCTLAAASLTPWGKLARGAKILRGADEAADLVSNPGDDVVYHYTDDAGRRAIEASGEIRNPNRGGENFFTPSRFCSGAEARECLALGRTPTGYFEVPTSRLPASTRGPYAVQGPRGPTGAYEYITPDPVDVTGLPFRPFPIGAQ